MGQTVSLGGALALAYYHEYRITDDVDAWWDEDIDEEHKQAVIQCLENTLSSFGEVRTRRWGDVFSIELVVPGLRHTAFSFQIAKRSARLNPSLPAPWPENLKLDSITDLLASKMVALIERGAPRDFRDIYIFCQEHLTTPEQCWRLWRERQKLSGSDADAPRARLAIQTHLARIAAHRPLEQIDDPDERAAAQRLRRWFSEEFLDALVD
ncbi:MAG: nucleotidyl transferase AbiEii/AbiGii toxin family protein [Anaerolineales bacterium]|nr:nucleotidyl transferase AbiEii/AbiGii toxin family protein [Anaerolineales bacterium]